MTKTLRPVAGIVTSSPTRTSRRLNYYVEHEASGASKPRFVARSGINGAAPRNMEILMDMNRRMWGKDVTLLRRYGKYDRPERVSRWVQAYSIIQSFAKEGVGALDPDDPADIEIAHEAGVALAKALAGDERYATVTTATDGKSGMLHNHIVLDSISKETGRSFKTGILLHSKLAKLHDAVLESIGLQQVNQLRKSARIVPKNAERALKRHEKWVKQPKGAEPFSAIVLQDRIDAALADESFTDFAGFVDVCKQHSVDAQQRGEKGRGISYRMIRVDQDGKRIRGSNGDIRRASKLGSDFMMDAVEAAIQRNIALQKVAPVVAPAVVPSVTPSSAAATAPAQKTEPTARDTEPVKPSFVSDADWDLWGDDLGPGVAWSSGKLLRNYEPTSATATAKETEEVAPVRDNAPVSATAAPKESVVAIPQVAKNDERKERETRTAPEPYVSALHKVKVKSPKAQARVDALAEYEDEVVPVLQVGGLLDESRLKSIGVGQRLVDGVGKQLHPLMRDHLDQRLRKQQLAKHFFETGQSGAAKRVRDEIALGWYSMAPMPADLVAAKDAATVTEQVGPVASPGPVKRVGAVQVEHQEEAKRSVVVDGSAAQREADAYHDEVAKQDAEDEYLAS